jgi:RimJ/RimL family protein N-acetyltransferase
MVIAPALPARALGLITPSFVTPDVALPQLPRYEVSDVRALGRNDLDPVLAHLLTLDADDRRLRFGLAVSDDLIQAYVDSLKFDTDDVFGIFAHSPQPSPHAPHPEAQLIGLSHMAYEVGNAVTKGETGAAEIGLSVSLSARGQGVGTALFLRASQRAATRYVRKLKLHYLVENRAMQHIAAKAGMTMHSQAGETDAYLVLHPVPVHPASH